MVRYRSVVTDLEDLEAQEQDDTKLLLGARLRHLRRMAGLTLVQVAEQAGISHSFLSMLERGQVDVSLSRLGRIADVYGIRLSELMVDNVIEATPRVFSLSELPQIGEEPGIVRRMFPHGEESGLQCLHIRVAPMTLDSDIHAHHGRVLVWVVSGTLTFGYGNELIEVLAERGIVYSGRVPHRLLNRTSDEVEVFAVNTPSYW